MTCARCAELEEENAYLKSELGLQRSIADRAALLDRFPAPIKNMGRPQAVDLLLTLYGAKGRPVTKWQIFEAVPSPSGRERSIEIVDMWVCYARKLLGFDAINTVRGLGYALTPVGMERVAAVLSDQARAVGVFSGSRLKGARK